MPPLGCRLLIVAWLFACADVAAAGEMPCELKVGAAVLAKHPGVQFRIKNENVGEMHAGVIEHVQRVQGEWLWLGRGWVQKRDIVSIKNAVEYFTAEIAKKPNAFCYLARAYAANMQVGVHNIAADKDIDEALRLDPNFPPALLANGERFHSRAQCDQAIECYDDAIWLNPVFADAYVERACSWASKARFEHAQKDLDRTIQLCPRMAIAYFLRSTVLQRQGRLDEAVSAAEQAIKLDPFDARVYQQLGSCWTLKGNDERAIVAYTESIRLDPKSGLAYLHRGQINSRHHEFQRALVDLNKAVELLPKNVEALEARGYVYYRLGVTEESIADRRAAARFRRPRTGDPAKKANPRDGETVSAPNQPDQKNESQTNAEFQIGDFGAQSTSTQAETSATTNQKIPKGDVWLIAASQLNHAARRWATSTDERYRSGARAIEMATEACEKTEWKRADYIDTLAAAYAETGDFETAIKWQTKAIELAIGASFKAEAERRLQLYRDHQPCREDRQGRLADGNQGDLLRR